MRCFSGCAWTWGKGGRWWREAELWKSSKRGEKCTGNTTERPSSKQVCFRINICSIHDGTPLWMHPSSHRRARTHACLLLSVRHSYVTRQPVVATFRLVDGIGTETGSFSRLRKLDFASARSSSLGKYLVVCSPCSLSRDSTVSPFSSRASSSLARFSSTGNANTDRINWINSIVSDSGHFSSGLPKSFFFRA